MQALLPLLALQACLLDLRTLLHPAGLEELASTTGVMVELAHDGMGLRLEDRLVVALVVVVALEETAGLVQIVDAAFLEPAITITAKAITLLQDSRVQPELRALLELPELPVDLQ